MENLKEAQIDLSSHQVTKKDNLFTVEEEHERVDPLIKSVDMFSCGSSDITGIDAKVMSHHLDIHPSAKSMVQRKHKFGEKMRLAIDEKVGKLIDVEFIIETLLYLTSQHDFGEERIEIINNPTHVPP